MVANGHSEGPNMRMITVFSPSSDRHLAVAREHHRLRKQDVSGNTDGDGKNFMCRDLKPENFLLANKSYDAPLKATDFGLSVFHKPGQVFTDIVGSAYYVAPEVSSRLGTAISKAMECSLTCLKAIR